MTNDEERKQNLGLGSTQPKEADEGVLRQQVLSNRQQLLSNLSANQPGTKPHISPVSSANTPQAPPPPQNQAVSQASLSAIGSPNQLAMPNIVEIVFDTLKSNCIEANKTLANTDAELHCQSPQSFQERVNKSDGQKIRFLRGLISLPNYSLVVDSTDQRIVVFIVPSEFVLGFDPDSELFNPHLVITNATQGGHVGWFLGTTIIGAVMIPEISRQLLRNLISVARGEVDPKQPFTYGSEQINSQGSGADNAQIASQAGIQAVSQQNLNVSSSPPQAINHAPPPPPPPPRVIESQIVSSQKSPSLPVNENPVGVDARTNQYQEEPRAENPAVVSSTRSQILIQLMKGVADLPKSSPVALLTESRFDSAKQEAGNGSDLSHGLKGLLKNAESSSIDNSSKDSGIAVMNTQNQSRNPLKDSMEFARLSELISQENDKSASLTNQSNTLPKPPGLQQPPVSPVPMPNPAASIPAALPQAPGMQKPPIAIDEPKVTSTLQELAVTVNPNASLSQPESSFETREGFVNSPVAAQSSMDSPSIDNNLSQTPPPQNVSNDIVVPDKPFSAVSSPSSMVQTPQPVATPGSYQPGQKLQSSANSHELIDSGLPKPPLAQTPPVLDSATPIQADITQGSNQPQIGQIHEINQTIMEEPKNSGELSQPTLAFGQQEQSLNNPLPEAVDSANQPKLAIDLTAKESSSIGAQSLSGELSQIANSVSEDNSQKIANDLKPTISGVSRPRKSLSSLLIPEEESIPEKPEPQSIAPGNLEQLVSDTETHLGQGCEELLGYIDKALTSLKALGVDAMQNDNLDQVTEIMQHTKRLKDLKDKLSALKNEVN